MPFIFEYINSIVYACFGIKLPIHAIIIAILIGILFLSFIIIYCGLALRLWYRLGVLQKNLKAFKQDNLLEYPTKWFNKRSKWFNGQNKLFNHLWAEYRQTLHEQRTLNPQTGVEELIAIRSTTSAETFFSPSVLVDGQLHTEFFKHLPGILTGLGIIGTFVGLIHGLQAFQIVENTEIVRQSLDQLLHGVYEAFVVSMVAIALAMFVTFVEKLLFSKLYGKVEELCFLIDSLYESGAGEEYLERLVKSSEDSASQAKIIKDALVDELRQILREVSQQQIQSTLTSQQQLGDQFRESIQAGISQPLQKIADGFNDQREHTGRDLSSALNDVFAGFTQRLQDLFGGQTTGIYDLQQKTVEALQATVKQFQQMATNIDATGRNTTNAMTETLAQTMKAMESRQQAINERMMEFMGQLRTVSQSNQAESGQKLQKLLGDLGQQMTKMVAELQAQSRSANDDHQGRQQQMADATIAAITRLSSGVETSLQTMQGQLTGMLTHLEKQTQSTAVQNTEQQRQLAEQNQQAIQALTSGVDRTVNQVSTQTADMLAKLAGTVESQQSTIADVVTKMVAELQAQSRSANDDHQGRQQQMADATIAAITRLSSGVETSLQTMQGQLTGMLTHLEKQTQSTAEYHQEQQRQLTVHNQQAVTTLTASVNETVDKVSTETTGMLAKLTALVEGHQLAAAEAIRSIQMAITQMSEVTTSALTGMNQGAENLILATEDFSKAGQSVAGVLHEATGVATKLSLSADAVSMATGTIESIVSDYATIRQQLNEMIQALKSTVESAKKEASLTTDVLTRINQATDKLAAAQNQADRYLDQVSEVLEQTHQEFSSSMRSTLNEANQQFFQHLTAAISLLGGSIEELDNVLSNFSARK